MGCVKSLVESKSGLGGRRDNRKLSRLDIGGRSGGCQAASLITVLRLSRCCAGRTAEVTLLKLLATLRCLLLRGLIWQIDEL